MENKNEFEPVFDYLCFLLEQPFIEAFEDLGISVYRHPNRPPFVSLDCDDNGNMYVLYRPDDGSEEKAVACAVYLAERLRIDTDMSTSPPTHNLTH